MEIKIRDIDVHYEEVGEGRPIIIIHSWTGNGRMFMGSYEPLFENRPGWRRIYPDLLGHGKTPAPVWLKGMDDVLDVLLEFIDTVAPGERFVVAGVSWGGYIARGIVHHRLKQIDGVMLYVPRIVLPVDKHMLAIHQVIRHDLEFIAAVQPGEEWVRDAVIVQSLTMLETMRNDFLKFFTETDPAVFSLLRDKPFSFDPDILLEPCPAPGLFLMGRYDTSVGYKSAWSILDNYPRATFAVLDAAGHFLGWEQTRLMQTLTSDWLDRVEEYVVQNSHK